MRPGTRIELVVWPDGIWFSTDPRGETLAKGTWSIEPQSGEVKANVDGEEERTSPPETRRDAMFRDAVIALVHVMGGPL